MNHLFRNHCGKKDLKVNLKIFFLLFTVLIFKSCSNSTEPQFNGNVPLGTWVYSKNIDNISIYYATSQFEENKPGIAFKDSSIFIERTSGWCATPPLSYTNVEGTWKVHNENTIKVTGLNWVSESYIRLIEIVSLSDEELRVIFHSVAE